MPCGCFGGGVKKAKEKVNLPPSDQSVLASQVKDQNDPNKTAKRRDVIASHYGDECALLGYKPTGSRPPSSCVDSPNSHTPSTAPLDASSHDSSVNSSSPLTKRSNKIRVASCRLQLAEKRREFFRDFISTDYHISPYALSSTLPARTRPTFGKPLRSTGTSSRPQSQPCEDEYPLPPGQHLLHPSPSDEREPKIDSDTLASQEFLLELKIASEEISRRWAMSEDDKEEYPSSLKMTLRDFPMQEKSIDLKESRDVKNVIISEVSHFPNDEAEISSIVPKTIITPPTPQVIDYTSLTFQELHNQEDITQETQTKSDELQNTIVLQPSELQQNLSSSCTSSSSSSERIVCMSEPEVSSEVLDDTSIEIKSDSDGKFQVSQEEECEAFASESQFSATADQEDEQIISPLEDDADDYPTNFVLDDQSQAEIQHLLDQESKLASVGIDEIIESDENVGESTIFANPFVQENDQEEIITPHDSRLQLIAEENFVDVPDDDINKPSSLLSEDDENKVPSSGIEMKKTYQKETDIENKENNINNEQYLHELEYSCDLKANDNQKLNSDIVQETLLEPTDSNLKFVEPSPLSKQDIDTEQEEICSTFSKVSSEHPKMDSTEVIHDDGLGSEIEEGSDIIEEQHAKSLEQNISFNKPT